jgi:archaellum biogenesis ATPase FlaH
MIEKLIFSHLVYDDNYARKVLPFVKEDYFADHLDRTLFKLVYAFVNKHNKLPSKEALAIEINNLDSVSDDGCKTLLKFVDELNFDQATDREWLVSQTEKFCQDKAIYNAIMQSIQILDDKTGQKPKGAIPQLLSDALAVSFDTAVGHDFFDDADKRYDFYHVKEKRIPFDLDYMNKITKGGIPSKTLNIVLAGTGVGKSLFMCHCAAGNLTKGYNVLYITLEMAEERIAERIDANLMNLSIDELSTLPRDVYHKKLERVKSSIKGKLVIKEYPTASAGTGHFRHLLNELKIKRNFIPDIIYVDYLNIAVSSRLKFGSNVNSYSYVKAIAEELRGLAVEFNVPIFSATQTTRSGYSSTDVGLEDTSESFGLPATADLMIALMAPEELQDLNQMLVKQLKNRYNDPNINKRFIVGVDRPKFKLYDVEQHAQNDIVDDGPSFDKTPSGKAFGEKLSKSVFDEFK